MVTTKKKPILQPPVPQEPDALKAWAENPPAGTEWVNGQSHIPLFEVSHSGINDRALFWKDFHGLAVQMN